MERLVLDNPCNGIGDAVMWCWTAHTLAKAGYTVKINPRRNHETFELFGTGPEWWTDEGTGRAHPPKGVKGRDGWLDEWVQGHAGRTLPVVRPPYVERAEDGTWADQLWADRDRATGKAARVVVCPEVVYRTREWPKASFGLLAGMLGDECNVVVVQQWYDANHSFPWAMGGLPLRRMSALLARAHVVVGNDSGPAHFAATIGTPTVVVCGPSDPELFFRHYPGVVPVRSGQVACSGCNFESGRGFRSYCDSGCAALATISPAQVASAVRETLKIEPELRARTMLLPMLAAKTETEMGSKLNARDFDDAYYREHQAAGLDYLGHGEWQLQYGRWFVESLGLKGKTVLDLGCACGSILRGLGAAGAVVCGVDISEALIRRGRERWPDMAPLLKVGHAADLTMYEDGTFDAIHCAQVAEHFKESLVAEILRECRRVLKPGGLLFLCLDTEELYQRQGRKDVTEDKTHRCIKSRRWWSGTAFECGGFEVLEGEGLTSHPDAFTRKYDWEWFLFRRPA